MSKWATLAVVSALIGFEADILGLLRYQIMSGSTTGSDRIRATPAVIITAFVLYVAMASLMALTKIGLPFNRPVAISSAIMSISAAALLVAGTGNREASIKQGYAIMTTDPYGGVLEISAATLALIVFVAVIIHLCKGGGSEQSSSRTSPSKEDA